MVNVHAAHNVRIGDHTIIVNGTLLAGHVEVGDRAFISGNCLVHQFTRIGTLALLQGGTGVGRDVPPFTLAHGINRLGGLNTIGLRRAGFSPVERMELKKIYHLLLRRREKFAPALSAAREQFTSAPARTMLDFMAASKRGICLDFEDGAASQNEIQDAVD
jgi:UDP-N-acetylglucosamine acyltransferase